MSRFFAFIVLIIHINTSMFIPVMDERDLFDRHGKQVDDINSLAEFIDQVILGNEDSTPEDEDDDQARYFNIYHLQYCVNEQKINLESNDNPVTPRKRFPLIDCHNFTSVIAEIVSPPPEA